MTRAQENIVKIAIRTRLLQGEDFYDIMESYPKITAEDKAMLTKYFIEEGLAEVK